MRHLPRSQDCRIPDLDFQGTVISRRELGCRVEAQNVYLSLVNDFHGPDADGVASLSGEFGRVDFGNTEVTGL